MSGSSFGGDLNTKKRNRSICKIGECSSNNKQKSDVIVVDKVIPISKSNVTHLSNIPIDFKDFLSVIDFHKNY